MTAVAAALLFASARLEAKTIACKQEQPTKPITVAGLAGLVFLGGCASTGVRSASPSGFPDGCKVATEQEVASLFERWNKSLETGDPHAVLANYADRSLLLPTLSNKPRVTAEEKEDYFHHFMANRPSGTIDMRVVEVGCGTAVDAGLYTFTFATGEAVRARYTFTYRWDGRKWLITSHHSSAMPEKE